MRCEYCGEAIETGAKKCAHCGAPAPAAMIDKDVWKKGEAVFYNGYTVWFLHSWERDSFEFQFWLGPQLVERFRMSRSLLDEFVPEGESVMPFIWSLFLVAAGEKDVLHWTEANKKEPAEFLIVRVDYAEQHGWKDMRPAEILEYVRAREMAQ